MHVSVLLPQILTALLAGGPAAPTAYIDPSTGGMLFQLLAVLLAAFSGVLFFFSRQIKTGIARLRRLGRKEPVETPRDEQP
jgi:hypothetical protein